MLRKIVYGTIIIAALTALTIGGCVGITLYEIQDKVAQVNELRNEYQQTNEKFELEAPLDDGMEPEQVATFFRIRNMMGEYVVETMSDIDNDLRGKNRSIMQGNSLGFFDLIQLLEIQFDRLNKLGRYHIKLLNDNQMALSTYVAMTRGMVTALAVASEEGTTLTTPLMQTHWERYGDACLYFDHMLATANDDRHRLTQPLQTTLNLHDRLLEQDHSATVSLQFQKILAADDAPLITHSAAVFEYQLIEEVKRSNSLFGFSMGSGSSDTTDQQQDNVIEEGADAADEALNDAANEVADIADAGGIPNQPSDEPGRIRQRLTEKSSTNDDVVVADKKRLTVYGPNLLDILVLEFETATQQQ
jgi:hypothetical protein